MKIVVHKTSGKETTKKVDLNNNVFGFTPNDHAIYLDVKQYLASKRSGTHKSKERSKSWNILLEKFPELFEYEDIESSNFLMH